MLKKYDCIVIGGGPAGSSAAFYLAKNGIETLLIDKEKFPREKVCGDCLTPTALKTAFENEFIDLNELPHYKLKGIKIVTSLAGTNTTDFLLRDDLPDFSIVTRRINLDSYLLKKAQEKGASVELGLKAEKIEEKEGYFILTTTGDGETVKFKTKFLIIATGNNTEFLIKNQILKPEAYRGIGVAIRSYFKLPEEIEPFMFILAQNDTWPAMGWIFPASTDTVNAGIGFYIEDKKKINKTLSAVFSAFINKSHYSSKILKNAAIQEKPRSLKIYMGGLKNYPHLSGILISGEAGGFVNPFTGEGIGFALKTGFTAASSVVYGLNKGLSPEKITDNYARIITEQIDPYLKRALFLRKVASSTFVTNLVVKLLNLSPTLSRHNIRYWIMS